MEDQDQQEPRIGMDVIDNADRFIGTVEKLEHDHFVVQKGFFFPKSHRIPNIAIDNIRQNALTLNISRAEAIHSYDEMKWANFRNEERSFRKLAMWRTLQPKAAWIHTRSS